MSSREQFEVWMTAEQWFHDSDFEWDERRNCYSQFGIHLAYKSWQAATSAMEAKCTALAADNDKAMESMRQADAVVKRAHEKYAEMAAENEVMKSAIDATIGWQQSTDAENVESVRMLVGIKTPATDAFLAEVRARESKRVYESIMDNPSVTDMESLVDWLEQNANDSLAYAAQLRQDANTAELVAAGIITRIEG